jgi:hypothetical protein
MRTGAGLVFICIGAILAFAVTTNTSVFNLHTAGWVIMLVGLVGLVVPRRTYGWLGRRLVRRTRAYPADRVVQAADVPRYRPARYPGFSRLSWGLRPRTTVLNGEPLEDNANAGLGDTPAEGIPNQTEVIEDFYEQ